MTDKSTDRMNSNPNPFRAGYLVIPTGFKANGAQHYYGTTDKMCRWETDRQSLVVITPDDQDDCVYVKHPDEKGPSTCYHPSELRMALPSECKPPRPKRQPLSRGCIVRIKDRVAIVAHELTGEGTCFDWQLLFLDDNGGLHYLRNSDDYTLLSKILPNGDVRPAEEV